MKCYLLIFHLVFFSVFQISASAEGDPVKGKSIYAACTACHGQNGEGLQTTNSPRLSGLLDSYLIGQLQKFRSGLRGADPQDIFGAQMIPFAKALPDEQAILDVVAYISTLKSSNIPRTENSGDPLRGETIYLEKGCARCHGTKGQGIKAQPTYRAQKYDAPRLAGQHDWYLIRQLQNFKAGIRGYTGDKSGLWMRLETIELDKVQMIKDLAAYIGTLER